MRKKTMGIHHISAIVGHPQENVDFYSGVLGLRLIKQTVNFDDPSTYHLYFGDKGGKPGTVITFFPWPDATQGKIGGGQVGVTSYAVPKGALNFWENRLEKFDIPYNKNSRFKETYLTFNDPHGLHLEIVEKEEGSINSWTFGEVTPEVAIKGFGGATLFSEKPDQTAELLEKVMGLEYVDKEGEFIRYRSTADIGNIIDLKAIPMERGQMGVGTVHHIAWRAIDDKDQLEWQKYVAENGYYVTSVKERNYFNAIYFREHGKILFEIATDPPGFAVDEQMSELGGKLMLPSWLEPKRREVEETLPSFEIHVLEEDK